MDLFDCVLEFIIGCKFLARHMLLVDIWQTEFSGTSHHNFFSGQKFRGEWLWLRGLVIV